MAEQLSLANKDTSEKERPRSYDNESFSSIDIEDEEHVITGGDVDESFEPADDNDESFEPADDNDEPFKPADDNDEPFEPANDNDEPFEPTDDTDESFEPASQKLDGLASRGSTV